jgi:hypothetical protein
MLLVTDLVVMGVVLVVVGAFVFPSHLNFVQQRLLTKSNFAFALQVPLLPKPSRWMNAVLLVAF